MTDARPPRLQHLQNDLRCVLADNPSSMTYWGTNTYILGTGQVAVIDPGPNDPAHMQAILSSLTPDETVSHIFVTHSHMDHSQLARPLAEATGAPIYAFGNSNSGRSAIMQNLANSELAGDGDGVDHGFAPDIVVADGQTFSGSSWRLVAHWTPGHFGNHMCFEYRNLLFTGDLVMGWASSLVSPPDGDLTDFMASLTKVSAIGSRTFWPGHGACVTDPAKRVDWLINHRLSRQSDILAQLAHGPSMAQTLTEKIYHDTPSVLLSAAERTVFAHLIDLVQSSQVSANGPLAARGVFQLT